MEQIINKDEFLTLAGAVLKLFEHQPDELSGTYTESLYRLLFRQPVLPDIHQNSPYSLAQRVERTVELFSSVGILADIAELRLALLNLASKERRHILRQAGIDPGSSSVVDASTQARLEKVDEKCQAIEELLVAAGRLQSRPVCYQAKADGLSERSVTQAAPSAAVSPEAQYRDHFRWLRALFSFTPETSGKSYRELAQLAIDHYYCMPHPDQAVTLVSNRKRPDLLKPDHGPDHVTRTQLLAEALVELFSRHDPAFREQLEKCPELRELIPLAMAYHDVTAEVEPKSVEEFRAAECFERDINASRRYSAEVVALVASALRNKESDVSDTVTPPCTADRDCSPTERRIRRILRLADRLDMVRATHIYRGWKQSDVPAPRGCFNSRYLDLPEQASQEFLQEFDALMEGAKDLASVTGGKPLSDQSDSGDYWQRYQLQGRNHIRKRKVARAVNAYDSVEASLDDNVRRKLAKEAGISTCQADHSKVALWSDLQASCVKQRDSLKGKRRWQRVGDRQPRLVRKESAREDHHEYLSAIHSERELRQIALPKAMTVLQKLMFEHRGCAGLSGTVKAGLQAERKRFREEGVRPPLGTLEQTALASEPARKRLRQDYGLDVVSEKRFCGYDGNGEPRYDTFLLTRPCQTRQDSVSQRTL